MRPILHGPDSPQSESEEAVAWWRTPIEDDHDPVQEAFEHWVWSAPSGTTHDDFHPDHWGGGDDFEVRTENSYGD